MKIRILDRVLVALVGILILAGCAALAAQLFFQVDVVGYVSGVLTSESSRVRTFVIAGGVVLVLLGLYCFLILFRHRTRKDRFVTQKTESGELAISLKALDSMVQKCLDQHPEISTQSVKLESQRDGLLIRIRGTLAGGISIPLTIDTLQKQIKQYVTACSGVEVKDIRVTIEETGEDSKDSVFAIEPPAAMPLLRGSADGQTEQKPDVPDEKKTAGPEEQAAPEVPASQEEKADNGAENEMSAAAAAAEMILNEAGDVQDDRPMHQRVFSTPEEPCVMPMPPAPVAEKENAELSEEPAQTAEPSENKAAEATGGDGETKESEKEEA